MESFKTLFLESFFDYIESFATALPRIIMATALFLVFLFLAFLIRKSMKRLLDQKFKDRLSGNFIITGFYWLVIILGIALSLRTAGLGGGLPVAWLPERE